MATKFKPLLAFKDKDTQVDFNSMPKWNKDLGTHKSANSYVYTDYDSFKEGSKVDTFDCVIMSFYEEVTGDDVEMYEDIFQHYGTAPVFAFVGQKLDDGEDDLKAAVQKFNANATFFFFEGEEKTAQAGAFLNAIKGCETQKAAMYKDVVCPAFAKFDKDGSNAIDRDELAALMKSLGTELSDDQVTTALKDLDINKDGVIDLSEFSRWFFTGMQSYGGVSRTLLRLKKGTGAGGVLKSLKDQFKDCLCGEDVKMKEHSVEVSFNEPANPGTVVELKISPHGPALKENYARLSEKYKDLHAHITAEDKRIFMYAEVRIKLSKDAGEAAAKFNEHVDFIFA